MGPVHLDHVVDHRPIYQLHATTEEDPGGARDGYINLRWWDPLDDLDTPRHTRVLTIYTNRYGCGTCYTPYSWDFYPGLRQLRLSIFFQPSSPSHNSRFRLRITSSMSLARSYTYWLIGRSRQTSSETSALFSRSPSLAPSFRQSS